MELKDIYSIWERFENSTITEIDLDINGAHLAMKKGGSPSAIQNESNLNEKSSEVKALPDNNVGNVSSEKLHENTKFIKAPLVGIFYKASAPDATPFVREGQQVKKGDVIGIIEAMKLMNEVIATEEGIVDKFLVEDETLVGFDQALISLK